MPEYMNLKAVEKDPNYTATLVLRGADEELPEPVELGGPGTEWNREEMEKLYLKMQKKAMEDEGFRKELLEDANKALEKLAGRPLPEGMRLNVIENDPSYTATMVLADMADEEIQLEDMKKVAGGISYALIITVCAAAASPTGVCAADVCGIKATNALGVVTKTGVCVGHVKQGVCVGHVCGLNA